VEKPTNPVASLDAIRLGGRVLGEWSEGSGLAETAVRSVAVVMLFKFAEHGGGVSVVDGQDAVEQLSLPRDAYLVTDLTSAGGAIHVDPTSVPVLNHLDFLCRVVLPGEATAGSISVIEQRARLGCMTPATCTLAKRRRSSWWMARSRGGARVKSASSRPVNSSTCP
jgi:hypothetical protein